MRYPRNVQNDPCSWSKVLVFLAVFVAAAWELAGATEKGGSVWPVGAESYATAAGVPHRGQTLFYQYNCFYVANELVDAKGHDSGVPDFKVRVVATAGKLSHNWGVKLLGGELGSWIALPSVYEQLGVAGTTYSKDDFSNIDITPITLFNHKGIVHWYYDLQVKTLGSGYQNGAALNVEQHNLAFKPAAAITLTPHGGAQNIMSRFDYVINDADHATHYRSGNEFFWQFGAQQEIPRHKSNVGLACYFYRQMTDDAQLGAPVVTTNADGTTSLGYKGRTLDLWPQVTVPWGKHGAIVMKWDHDMLVQNRARGNGFWFQFGVPFSYLHHSPRCVSGIDS